MGTIVDWSSLGEAAYVSVAVGLGVLLIAAVGVASSLRAEDERGAGRESSAVALNGVTVVCVLALLAAIGTGIYLLTQ
jgi:UPF0716 family protein affecting phage T7 exclusion